MNKTQEAPNKLVTMEFADDDLEYLKTEIKEAQSNADHCKSMMKSYQRDVEQHEKRLTHLQAIVQRLQGVDLAEIGRGAKRLETE